MDDNKRFLDHLGVTAWHTAGWTGSRGVTATGEELGSSNHAENTEEVFRLIAPDRKLIFLPTGTSYIGGKYYHKLLTDAVPEIMAQGVDTLYASLVDNTCNVADIDAGLAPIADRCSLFFAAGNDGDKKASRIIQSRYVWGVGAYYLMADSGEMRPANFSSVSDAVEFAAPTLINRFSGTSCATPCLAGMAALVGDMAIAKTGRPLSQDGMHRFLLDCCVDLNDAGRDSKTGWGAPILPPPETVDITKYQTGSLYKDDADIPKFAREGIAYCAANGIMQGDADGTFRPGDTVTRAELATVIARLDGRKERT